MSLLKKLFGVSEPAEKPQNKESKQETSKPKFENYKPLLVNSFLHHREIIYKKTMEQGISAYNVALDIIKPSLLVIAELQLGDNKDKWNNVPYRVLLAYCGNEKAIQLEEDSNKKEGSRHFTLNYLIDLHRKYSTEKIIVSVNYFIAAMVLQLFLSVEYGEEPDFNLMWYSLERLLFYPNNIYEESGGQLVQESIDCWGVLATVFDFDKYFAEVYKRDLSTLQFT
ncbi:MAG: hypothetical protein FWG64_09490 [Firmicutes bacterium]|nr:hypothetical protein [Bacillota bacterium]